MFYSPGEVFDDIRTKPTWLVVLHRHDRPDRRSAGDRPAPHGQRGDHPRATRRPRRRDRATTRSNRWSPAARRSPGSSPIITAVVVPDHVGDPRRDLPSDAQDGRFRDRLSSRPSRPRCTPTGRASAVATILMVAPDPTGRQDHRAGDPESGEIPPRGAAARRRPGVAQLHGQHLQRLQHLDARPPGHRLQDRRSPADRPRRHRGPRSLGDLARRQGGDGRCSRACSVSREGSR